MNGLQRQKYKPMTLVSGICGYSRGFLLAGTSNEMRVGLSTTAIFGDSSGYFFGNFRDKASNIIRRYATPCWPVTDCKMNDLEWLFHVKVGFRTSSFRFREFYFDA